MPWVLLYVNLFGRFVERVGQPGVFFQAQPFAPDGGVEAAGGDDGGELPWGSCQPVCRLLTSAFRRRAKPERTVRQKSSTDCTCTGGVFW